VPGCEHRELLLRLRWATIDVEEADSVQFWQLGDDQDCNNEGVDKKVANLPVCHVANKQESAVKMRVKTIKSLVGTAELQHT
jgi:hypothetical protein